MALGWVTMTEIFSIGSSPPMRRMKRANGSNAALVTICWRSAADLLPDKITPHPNRRKRPKSRRRGRHAANSLYQQRALETLPGKMEELQSSITEMETLLPIQNSTQKIGQRFETVTQSLSPAMAELTAEEEWLELELLREEIEGLKDPPLPEKGGVVIEGTTRPMKSLNLHSDCGAQRPYISTREQ